MAFDPEYPAHGVKLKSAEMRAQFAALKALSDGLTAQAAALAAQADALSGQLAALQAEVDALPPDPASLTALTAGLATTALNPSGVPPFSGSISDPPTQSEMQALAAWSEGLRTALTRTP